MGVGTNKRSPLLHTSSKKKRKLLMVLNVTFDGKKEAVNIVFCGHVDGGK
jgi:hypothetical protein